MPDEAPRPAVMTARERRARALIATHIVALHDADALEAANPRDSRCLREAQRLRGVADAAWFDASRLFRGPGSPREHAARFRAAVREACAWVYGPPIGR
jgi:hypothetical protein